MVNRANTKKAKAIWDVVEEAAKHAPEWVKQSAVNVREGVQPPVSGLKWATRADIGKSYVSFNGAGDFTACGLLTAEHPWFSGDTIALNRPAVSTGVASDYSDVQDGRKLKAKGRPSWDEYFLNIAIETAKRSTCNRRQVGAVIVSNNRIITTGYNGSPSGDEHCLDSGCKLEDVDGEKHCWRCIHAEQNAVLVAASVGISVKGAKIYVTFPPCHNCMKAIRGAGIVEICLPAEYYMRFHYKSSSLSGSITITPIQV